MSKSYMDQIREISAKISMNFYNNSAEDTGEICINRPDWNYDSNSLKVTAPDTDWFFAKRNQISTYGMKTKRYACLDGYLKLVESSSDKEACYLADASPNGIMGLWSEKCSSDLDGTYSVGNEPIFTIYYNEPRKLNQVIVIGNPELKQFPVDYEIRLYDNLTMAPMMMFMSAQVLADPIIGTDQEGRQIIGTRDDLNQCFVFDITGGKAFEQTLTFLTQANSTNNEPNIITFKRMELKIKKWSHPGAVAKIMYFSREISMIFNGDEIKSIEVLEEKTAESGKLSFGLSSNSCTVYTKDDGRFSNNLALLKRNKTILPYLALKDGNIPLKDTDYVSLGRYYSDSWEMDSKSHFVKCKAYDDMYALQNIMLEFPLQQDDTSYSVRTGVEVSDLLKEVIEMVNTEKHNQEIYGADIMLDENNIDSLLNNIKIPYVLFERKSAWDVLQDIANFALCNIYVNRLGKICARVDAPPSGLVSSPAPVTLTDSTITPDNSFTYALPIQTKTIVNRVEMPYYYLTTGDSKDDSIEIKPEKIQTINYVEAGVAKSKMVFTVKLKNFYKKITGINLFNVVGDREDSVNGNIFMEKIYFNEIYFETTVFNVPKKLKVNILHTGTFVLLDDKLTLENINKLSIKTNGVCEYKHNSNLLMVGMDIATTAANKILGKYNDGANFLETDWIGSPILQPSYLINCRNRIDENLQAYECLSNEFTFDGGLRVKTKLRK